MNIDDKTPNDIDPNDPANQAASLANMTLKSPKPGTNVPKQKRPRKAADAMGGAAAKDKPAKGKSRKKALSFDDLAHATAAANVVSIAEARSGTDSAETPVADLPSAAPEAAGEPAPMAAAAEPIAAAPAPEEPLWEAAAAPVAEPQPVEIPVAEIAAEVEPLPAVEPAPVPQADSMDAALEQSQALLAQAMDDALATQVEEAPEAAPAEPLWTAPAPSPAAPAMPDAPKPEPVAAPAYSNGNGSSNGYANGNGAHAPAEPAAPAEDSNGSSAGRSRFEAIAARAARAQGARSQPGSAVQAALAAQQQAAEKARQGNDFYSFWAQRKNGRRFPSYGDFDAKQIAELWPNTMLLSCGAISGGNVNFTQVMRLTGAAATAENAEEVTFTPMLTEWMLAIGREAVSAGKPVQDIETFQNTVGSSSYRIVALPLGNEETQVDHVLCNLARA